MEWFTSVIGNILPIETRASALEKEKLIISKKIREDKRFDSSDEQLSEAVKAETLEDKTEVVIPKRIGGFIQDIKRDKRCTIPDSCYDTKTSWKHGPFCPLIGKCLFCNIHLGYQPDECELHLKDCPYYLSIKCNSYNICKEDGIHWINCPSRGQSFKNEK